MRLEGKTTIVTGGSRGIGAAIARRFAAEHWPVAGQEISAPCGILTNVIQPGLIKTEMNPNDEREAVRVMTAMTALKRYGRVEEIAALAAFLASDESSYITGTTIVIDGGFSV